MSELEHTPEHTEEAAEATPVQKATPRKMMPLLWGVVGAVALGLLITGGYSVYGVYQGEITPSAERTARWLNLTVAKVDGESLTFADYIRDRRSIHQFYTTQAGQNSAPVTAEEESDRVVSRLIVNKIIEKVAAEKNITISDADVATAQAEFLATYNGDQAAAEAALQQNYGLSLDEFMNRIVRAVLLEKKLAEKYIADNGGEASKAKAEELIKRIKGGEDFAKLAKEFGTDSTKDKGGDLDWFGKGQMVPEFEAAVFALKAGELGPTPVKTQFGYHVVRIDGIRKVKSTVKGQPDQTQVRARHILLPVDENAYAQFVKDRLANAKIKIYGGIHNPFEGILEKLKAAEAASATTSTSTVQN